MNPHLPRPNRRGFLLLPLRIKTVQRPGNMTVRIFRAVPSALRMRTEYFIGIECRGHVIRSRWSHPQNITNISENKFWFVGVLNRSERQVAIHERDDLGQRRAGIRAQPAEQMLPRKPIEKPLPKEPEKKEDQ